MRILYITSRADHGGGPEHLFRLVEHLPSGFQAWVACPDDRPYRERYEHLSAVKGVHEIAHRAFRLGDLRSLCALINERGIECIHSHGKGAGLLGRLAGLLTGVPCVHTYHGVHMGEYGPIRRSLYTLYERVMGRVTARNIAVSAGERKEILELKFSPSDKLELITNGVVLPDATAVEPKWGQRLDVVMVSRFDHQKNTSAVVKIMEQLAEMGELDRFRFVFLGDGEFRGDVERAVNEQWGKGKAVFAGFVSGVGDYLQNAFCFLSTSRWEGMPLAVLEAMSYGVPVVVSDVVGNRDAAESVGLLFDVEDHGHAARLLCGLSCDSSQWVRLSKAVRMKALKFYSVECMVNATVVVYGSL